MVKLIEGPIIIRVKYTTESFRLHRRNREGFRDFRSIEEFKDWMYSTRFSSIEQVIKYTLLENMEYQSQMIYPDERMLHEAGET